MERTVLKHLDLTLLQAFATVVDSGSFTRAAHYLCRTQSAVSMQVQKLEEIAGRQLFQRDKRQIRLTEEGKVLLGFARRMICLNQDALAALDQPCAEGHVRLGMPDDYAHCFLPNVLALFAHAYPRVQLEVIGALSGELLDRIEAGKLDLAIITRQPGRRAGELLRRERLVWVSACHHLVHEEATLPLALYPEGCVFRAHALAALDAKGRAWRIAYCSQSFAGGTLAVSAGLAVTVVAQSMVPIGWQILGPDSNLPALPEVEITLHRASNMPMRAVLLLEEQLIQCAQGMSFGSLTGNDPMP